MIISIVINFLLIMLFILIYLKHSSIKERHNDSLFINNYKNFLDSINIATLVLDKVTNDTIFCNNSFSNNFLTKNELPSYKHIFDKKISKEIENILNNKKYISEMTVNNRFFILSVTTVHDLIFIFFNDVTQLKDNEIMKRRYIDSISHELKTPLTNILLYSELIICKESVCSEEVQIINKNALSLKKMILDILELSKLDTPDIVISTQEIKLRRLFVQVMNNLIPFAEISRVDIEIDIDSNIVIEGNEELLYKAFKNLVENGIKYNANCGLVKIKARKIEDFIEIKIIDNGDGISQEDIVHIFERFYRVDKSRTKGERKDGTGLGLSIVENVVRLHKGTISVDSTLGEETTFTILLPN